jgi:hypothetical protein
MPLPDLNLETLKDNPLASQLGIRGTNNNMLQFFNRFGENNLIQDRPLATVIAQPYYFNVQWTFNAGIDRSNVESLLMASIKESSTDALKYFVQGVELPDLVSYSPIEPVASEFGMASNPGLFVKPSENTFKVQFMSTEFSLHEHVFYYWLREATDSTWAYADRPFTKAKLQVTFLDSRSKKRMFSYVLTNVYPQLISTLKPNHSPESQLTRGVTFAFDNMYVLPASETEQNRLEKAFDKYVGDKIGRALTTGVNRELPTIPGI